MLFNGSMTYPEALKVLYTAIEGKSKEEIAKIRNDFQSIIPEITNKELEGPPALTSYKIDLLTGSEKETLSNAMAQNKGECHGK